jgi:tetratricopeptide (TPR) repeat protein
MILDLIFKKKFDEASAAIEDARDVVPSNECHRFVALSAVLQSELGNSDAAINLMKIAIREAPRWLPHHYRLADFLMQSERWAQALAALDALIALSEEADDTYFIDDARVRKILCLKAVGRNDEVEFEKGKIATGTTALIGNKTYRLDDL